MANELEKTLSRLRVTIKSREVLITPARGFPAGLRLWRVSLERAVRGEDKPLKLTLTLLSKEKETPTAAEVIGCLANDVEAGEMSLWDFGLAYNNGKTDPHAESMHKTCKRIGPRVKRFFGDGWAKLVNHVPKAA
jgi:hypothetical protein